MYALFLLVISNFSLALEFVTKLERVIEINDIDPKIVRTFFIKPVIK